MVVDVLGDDALPPVDEDALPELEELEEILGAGVPQATPAVFHYVGGQVEAEVFLPFDWCADLDRLAALNARIADRVAGSPHWGRIALMCRIAP